MTLSDMNGDDLVARFENPDQAEYGPVPIWWWSGAPLDRGRLRWQMEQMLSQGVAQAVVMNLAPNGPLYGSLADDPPFMSEPWWALFATACADAEELGFRLWAYDQLGFSGANFQGRLVTGHPEWAGRALGYEEATTREKRPLVVSAPKGAEALAAYLVEGGVIDFVDVDGSGTARADGPGTLVVAYSIEKGFDYFDEVAGGALIDSIHGEFERRVGRYLGSVIPGFFQDEMPDVPSWGARFEVTFRERYGYDIVAMLPAVLGHADAAQPGVAQARADYHAHRAELAREAFFAPLQAWAGRHGLQYGFDQQSPVREGDPPASVKHYGDYLALHAGYSAPGSDHWGDPKLHGSLAAVNGNRRSWLEAFHSSGWGGTLEETWDWLTAMFRRGANLYSPHAVYYATPGAWWEWAAPSTCWRQPYWPHYSQFARAVGRLSHLLATSSLDAHTALLYPTTDSQTLQTLSGWKGDAYAEDLAYHRLNGASTWYREKPGLLDRAGVEYAILPETAIGSGVVSGGALTAGEARFSTVIVPDCRAVPVDVADALSRLALSGGAVIVVGSAPNVFLGAADDDPRVTAFREAVKSSAITVVDVPDRVVERIPRPDRGISARVPHVVRTQGDRTIVLLVAHDDETGTAQPIVDGTVWPRRSDYSEPDPFWPGYWEQARTVGYTYRPVGDRSERVTVHGYAGQEAQRWDLRTGERRSLGRLGESTELEIGFDEGTAAVLVFGDDLPAAPPWSAFRPATHLALDHWSILAESTLDNTWADAADARRLGVLPIEVWAVETAEGEHPERWTLSHAGFGPFASISGPSTPADHEPSWREAAWSLSSGIRGDRIHGATLGPNGYVPYEFVEWPAGDPGSVVALKTWVELPPDVDAVLTIGAHSDVTAQAGGTGLRVVGDGYWRNAAMPRGFSGQLLITLTAPDGAPQRLAFGFRDAAEPLGLPEWISTTGEPMRDTVIEVERSFVVPPGAADLRVQIGTEQPSTVLLNGVELGRHGAFEPYEGRRIVRYHPYDLTPHLVDGANLLTVRCTDPGRPVVVWVDSIPAAERGLGLSTSHLSGWLAHRADTEVGLALRTRRTEDPKSADPRLGLLAPRPHPLPAAEWLEPAVLGTPYLDIVTDIDPASTGPRWLRLRLPHGAIRVVVPTRLTFQAFRNDRVVVVTRTADGGAIDLGSPSIDGVLVLRFEGDGGRRGGALLDRGIEVEVASAPGALGSWAELGLESTAGRVVYSTELPGPAELGLDQGDTLRLDLGEVRGSVEIRIDGTTVATRSWSPYVAEIPAAALAGARRLDVVVVNTLAGYMAAATPTPSLFAGQTRAGLFGPVRLQVDRASAAQGADGQRAEA